MANSRRTFLKSTIAGAGVAMDGLRSLAKSSNRNTDAAAPAAGPKSAGVESALSAEEYTRGLGVYPGNPKEHFGPSLVTAGTNYRNLALLRPAYHSSSYDYNLTAQLVTDGIKDTHLPEWVVTDAYLSYTGDLNPGGEGSRGQLPKHEREFFLDQNPTSTVDIAGQRPWVQVQLGGGVKVPEVDRVDLVIVAGFPIDSPGDLEAAKAAAAEGRKPIIIAPNVVKPENMTVTVSVSADGREWKEAGHVTNPAPASLEGFPPDLARPGQLFTPSIPLSPVSQSRFYRVDFTSDNVWQWRVSEVAFFRQDWRVNIGGPYSFTSAWMSAGLGEEWVYVDLGASCEFDHVVLYWIERAAEGSLQVSDDARNWKDIQALPAGPGLTDDMKLASPVRGRYVRVLMKQPASPYGYILSEFEVYGRGGFVAQPKAAPAARADGRLDLAGGAWRLQRDSLVDANGEALSQPGFQDSDWIVATVPGTVLSSYVNVGAVPELIYGDNQMYISDSFFYADFWYRNEFTAPPVAEGQRVWLNFDGINWKADVFLNGVKIGRIEGAFTRGRFDVTGRLLAGRKNALAVRILKHDHPGSVKTRTLESAYANGGALGLDSPTFTASVGWDWMPCVRGRNTGIWDDVYLTLSGPVTIEDPFVTTALPLPDTSRADVSVEVSLTNHEPKAVAGILRGRLGEVAFEQPVTVPGSASKKVKLDPSTHPALRLHNPKLWWPVGYGEPNMYDVELKFETPGRKASDTKTFQVGVRQLAYSEEGSALKMWINGRRIVPLGGHTSFSEALLRYRAREYDTLLRYHRGLNFHVLRNWTGQVAGDEFLKACDRYGILLWQEFWLANPWDGPNPLDHTMFLENAKDRVLRDRNHPCLLLYCARNEGFPPKPIEDGLRKILTELHPGIHYILSSADVVVSGHGPYMSMPRRFYFQNRETPKFHSEIGQVSVPTIESVRAMMPEESLWPPNEMWGLHDYCTDGNQHCNLHLKMIERFFGSASNVDEWVSLAQFVNYEGCRAMFEAQAKNRMGVLLWACGPGWPSFVWQSHDYYLEPSASYFGCKKGAESLHILWNPMTESIDVVNHCAGNVQGLTARVEVFNMDGTKKWEKTASLDIAEDSISSCIKMEYPSGLTPVHFLRLTLTHNGDPVSLNTYMRSCEENDYRAIRALPKVKLEAATRAEREGDHWRFTTKVRNVSSHPALMVRLKAVREKSGDRILPVFYADNYLTLMPGELRTIQTELYHADTRGENPKIVVEGFNVGEVA